MNKMLIYNYLPISTSLFMYSTGVSAGILTHGIEFVLVVVGLGANNAEPFVTLLLSLGRLMLSTRSMKSSRLISTLAPKVAEEDVKTLLSLML